jgi:hypothetical protein
MKRLAIAAALVASFALGGTVSGIGLPSEPTIVAGLQACVITDKAAAWSIPAARIPATVAACTSFRVHWLGLLRPRP